MMQWSSFVELVGLWDREGHGDAHFTRGLGLHFYLAQTPIAFPGQQEVHWRSAWRTGGAALTLCRAGCAARAPVGRHRHTRVRDGALPLLSDAEAFARM